jgi:hypothetical protein
MYVVIFITATIVGLLFYIQRQTKYLNPRLRKIASGYFPKNGLSRYLTYTEPNITSNYLQTTNNYPHVNKCVSDQGNVELCSETPSNQIESNIQYAKQPYVIFS